MKCNLELQIIMRMVIGMEMRMRIEMRTEIHMTVTMRTTAAIETHMGITMPVSVDWFFIPSKHNKKGSGEKVWGFSWKVRIREISEGKTQYQNRERKRERERFMKKLLSVLQEFDVERKALRVIPRGNQWLTVYRAHQV